MSIVLVGLGMGPNQITKEGENAIRTAKNVVVLTEKSPSYSFFENIPHLTLDKFFDEAESFDETNQRAVEFILSLKGDTAVCFDGDGLTGGIPSLLIKKAKNLSYAPGVSPNTLLKSKVDFAGSYISYTATDFINNPPVEISRNLPVFITEIDDNFIASEVKLILLDKVGEEEIIFIKSRAKTISVLELDRQNCDHTARIVIPPVPLTERARYGFSDLIEIMKILRAPSGCPWDREQTHQSIRKNLIEEAYELDEAIEKEDITMMTEECGDVLLQSAFNALIAEEEGEFTLSDVMSMLCTKLVNRHTHIFGDVKASNATEALLAWESAKKKEKEGKGKFDTVPKAMPALLRAQKILKCAGVQKTPSSSPKSAKEWGEILFDAVKQMRNDGIDAEEALSDAISGFIREEE